VKKHAELGSKVKSFASLAYWFYFHSDLR